MKVYNDFGLAPIRQEGKQIKFDINEPDREIPVDTCPTEWLEFPVPCDILSDLICHINVFLTKRNLSKYSLNELDYLP